MWCHNPESQEAMIEQLALERLLDDKRFVSKSAVGSWQSADTVMEESLKDLVFFQESGGGVTFSGGEPLMQADFLAELLSACRAASVHTAVDTCGHADPAVFSKIMDLADLWLFDIKLMDDLKHLEFTGVSNKLLLMNLESLAKNKKQVIIRFPVIPGITDTPENMEAIAATMERLGLRVISALPYHVIARDKYKRMNKDYMLTGTVGPDEQRMEEVTKFFSEKGYEIYR